MPRAFISILAAGSLALAAATAPAAAGPKPHFGHFGHHHHHKPLHGGAKGGMGYVGYIPFCAATGLILSGIYVGHTEHRELTTDEALGIVGTCIFPPLALIYMLQPNR
jgi:hypothetical protein